MNNKINLEELKKKSLIIDIETSAFYDNGEPVDIRTNFEDYVKLAKVKWIGMYSYLLDEYLEINVIQTDSKIIQDYIAQHDIIIGFNSDEFDLPILYNNNMMPEEKRFNSVDCMVILGASTFYKHDGLPFKNRGILMGFKFKRNSLKAMAQTMNLETQKGDIDYKIFFKDFWNEEEIKDIKKYLRGDIEATKQMFDKLWDFWIPFTEFISEDNITKLSWIKSSIATLTYEAACNILGVEATYADRSDRVIEEMGGRAIDPVYEEARNIWYIDFTSLYPHIFSMFNLFAEIKNNNDFNGCMEYDIPVWHGNTLFQVKGYYDISRQHILSKDVEIKLKERIRLKKEEPDNPLIYTYKIFLNSLYGAVRSPIFEKIHTENAGYDCCYLGQQIHEYTEKRMKAFGFETIGGFTDSLFLKYESGDTTEYYIKSCLKKVVQEIKDNVPFPVETFDIEIEKFMDYIMYPFSMQSIQGEDGKNLKNEKGKLIKELKGKRNNYAYIYQKDGEKILKLVGLPIKKDNATNLGRLMFNETLKTLFLERTRCKITNQEMTDILDKYLIKPDAMKLLAREFKVKPDSSYKLDKNGNPSNCIQAQISRGYFDGQGGVIELILNNKIGNAGKTKKYCTYEEAIDAGLTVKDLDLTKLRNELEAFVKNG